MLTNSSLSTNLGPNAAIKPAPDLGLSNQERPKVLLIEDDPVLVKILSFALENRGVGVTVASDGKKAFEMMDSLEEPSLILLDLMLPFYSGYEILSKIRGESGWNDVPIIVMTANGKERNAARAFDAGANDYLVKPIRFEELMVRLRSFTEYH